MICKKESDVIKCNAQIFMDNKYRLYGALFAQKSVYKPIPIWGLTFFLICLYYVWTVGVVNGDYAVPFWTLCPRVDDKKLKVTLFVLNLIMMLWDFFSGIFHKMCEHLGFVLPTCLCLMTALDIGYLHSTLHAQSFLYWPHWCGLLWKSRMTWVCHCRWGCL
jgi:hypothetical protein